MALLNWLTGNHFGQKLLEKNIWESQKLMGIGSGAGVGSSGEQIAFKLLQEKCQAPYCIFDVGSNRGQYLNALLSLIPVNNCTVHCFEPSSYTFNLLKENSPDNRNIYLNHMALGQEIGEMPLYYNGLGSELASLSKRKLDHINVNFNQSEMVKIDTLDHYCEQNSIDRIHLLKLDVEGHELDVLAGATNLFSKGGVEIVAFEFGGTNIDSRSFFRDFYYFFKDQKMSILRITPSGYLYPIHWYSEIFERFMYTNFLAIKNT